MSTRLGRYWKAVLLHLHIIHFTNPIRVLLSCRDKGDLFVFGFNAPKVFRIVTKHILVRACRQLHREGEKGRTERVIRTYGWTN